MRLSGKGVKVELLLGVSRGFRIGAIAEESQEVINGGTSVSGNTVEADSGGIVDTEFEASPSPSAIAVLATGTCRSWPSILSRGGFSLASAGLMTDILVSEVIDIGELGSVAAEDSMGSSISFFIPKIFLSKSLMASLDTGRNNEDP